MTCGVVEDLRAGRQSRPCSEQGTRRKACRLADISTWQSGLALRDLLLVVVQNDLQGVDVGLLPWCAGLLKQRPAGSILQALGRHIRSHHALVDADLDEL